MSGVLVVDSESMPWRYGRSAAGRASASAEAGEETPDDLRTESRTLFVDPETGERVVRSRATGFGGVTPRYHHSVEEAFLLAGRTDLRGEGVFAAGCYFWRPAGWVHASNPTEGRESLIFTIGVNEREASGPHTDVMCDLEQEGTNPLHESHEAAIGPRGWIRNLDSALVAWQPGPLYAREQGPLDGFGVERVEVKVLSRNVHTGGQTILMRFGPGYTQQFEGSCSERLQLYVLSGALTLGRGSAQPGTYIRVEPGSQIPRLASRLGATALVKVGGWLDFRTP
jgi:hypothetical protein